MITTLCSPPRSPSSATSTAPPPSTPPFPAPAPYPTRMNPGSSAWDSPPTPAALADSPPAAQHCDKYSYGANQMPDKATRRPRQRRPRLHDHDPPTRRRLFLEALLAG